MPTDSLIVNTSPDQSPERRDPLDRPLAAGAWTRAEPPHVDLVLAEALERIAATPRIRQDRVDDARLYLDVRPTPSGEELADVVVGWWGDDGWWSV